MLTKFWLTWFCAVKSGNRESAVKTPLVMEPVVVVEYATEVLAVEMTGVNCVPLSKLFGTITVAKSLLRAKLNLTESPATNGFP